MEQPTLSAIARLVAHHDGPVNVSKLLGGAPVYQEIQRWVKRGWASPMHIFSLEPLLPEGMTLRDLHVDREASASDQQERGAEKPTDRATASQKTTDRRHQDRRHDTRRVSDRPQAGGRRG